MPYAPEGGGGGAGFALGPATNTFNAATKAAGVTARNTYASSNAAWLAKYDANPSLLVRVTWPTTPTNEAWYGRAASAWVELTGVVQGAQGPAGPAAALLSLTVEKATAAGVAEGDALVFQRADGDFDIAISPTQSAPRIKLTLPAGRTLLQAVNAVDGDYTTGFTRDGQTQVWLSDDDWNGFAALWLIRTSA